MATASTAATAGIGGDGWSPDGGAGVARACVRKIPIDNPTPVKMPNGGIDMLGCVG